MTYRVTVGISLLVLLSARASYAGALGIPLDGFLAQFQTFVIGMGLIIGLVGLVGYVGSLMDNPFSNILAGSVGFFTKAGLLGGGTVLMGLLGLVGGATLCCKQTPIVRRLRNGNFLPMCGRLPTWESGTDG